jgi:hypothetical protein
MGDENPPKLSLVAQADPVELEKQQAHRDLGYDIREMDANLLRIIRGAGRPHELPQQIINLGGAILETHKTARAWAIWSALEDELHSGVPSYWEARESTRHETTIARGALQLVASRLVHQRAQEAAGGREIDEGIDELEETRERQRKRWLAEAAQLRAEQRPARKRRKPSPAKQSRSASPPPTVSGDRPQEPAPAAPKSTAEFMKSRRDQLRDEKD